MVRLSSVLFLIGLMLTSCGISKNAAPLRTSINQIVITSSNLSEDASILSTQEDELLFLVFSIIENQPAQIIVQEVFTFDKDIRSFTTQVDDIALSFPTLIALLELDSSISIKKVSELVKLHHEALRQAFRNHDLEKIETILNDDDLLGIQVLDSNDRTINFNGIWRMDRYAYQVSLVAHQ